MLRAATALMLLLASATTSLAEGSCTTLASGLTFTQLPVQGVGFAFGKLVVDSGTAYWFDYDASLEFAGGALRSVPTRGGAVTDLATGLGGVNDFAVDDTHLYWTEFEIVGASGSVKRVPVGGGAVDVLASGLPAGSIFDVFFPLGIALDDALVYWGEGVGGGAIRTVPKDGGGVVDIGRGEAIAPSSIALDSTYAYISETDGRVLRLPLAGGSAEELATGLEQPFSMVLNANSLFWVSLVGSGAALTLPKAGGSVTILADGLFNPRSVAIRGSYAYFSPGSSGGGPSPPSVMKVRRTGGIPSIVSGADCSAQSIIPFWLAMDGGVIYGLATNSGAGDGMVVELPEPGLELLQLAAVGGLVWLGRRRRSSGRDRQAHVVQSVPNRLASLEEFA
jgi:hypothetical protein